MNCVSVQGLPMFVPHCSARFSVRSSHLVRHRFLLPALIAATLVSAEAAIDNSSAQITQATTAFVQQKSPKLKSTVQVEQVKGDYARALVKARGKDNAWAYLYRRQGSWTVLSLGTGFDAKFYRQQGIPKELQLPATAPKTTPPIAPDAPDTPVTLARNPGSSPIGVEPQGGHFSAVIRPSESPSGTYTFSTYGKNQTDSILAIYATNASLIPLAKPLARVRLAGLKSGETERRIRVDMKLTPERTLLISARDLKNPNNLTVTQLHESDLRVARLQSPSQPPAAPGSPTPLVPGLLRIATGPNATAAPLPAPKPAELKPGAIKRFIGLRGAGGIFNPVLYPSDTPQSTAAEPRSAYFCTSFPGQRTVDLRLFSGDSPYIEQAKPYTRYIISGIKPNARLKNAIKLELQVGPWGKVIPTATEMATGTKLKVDKYSSSTLTRLQSEGQLGQRQPMADESFPGRIPATPLQ